MKLTYHSLSKLGCLLGGAATLALTGCVTYVDRQPTRVVHAPPPPPIVEPPPPPPPPAVVVIRHERDFYEPLNPYGEWVVVPSYGRCWRPARVMAGWRPYADGHWERTDVGWYWASEEPWAWATYHYGRWDWTPEYGWVWMPQTEWAPAWVAWRAGEGYIGWAPLPPSARVGVGGFVEVRDTVIAPRFVFVEERRLQERVRPTTVIVNNTTVINKTVNITKIKVVNQTVINEGPRPEAVERVSGRKIHAVAVRDLRHKDETEFESRRNVRPGQNQKVEPAAPVVTEPQQAVMPHVATPVAPVAETVKETPAVAADPQTDETRGNNRRERPLHPDHREPPRAEKKPEVVPAAIPNVQPEPQRAVLPEPKPIEKQAEVAKETMHSPVKNHGHETHEQKPVVPAAVNHHATPAKPALSEAAENKGQKSPAVEKRAEPQAQRDMKPSKPKSNGGEKAPGKPETKTHGGASASTNNAATPHRNR